MAGPGSASASLRRRSGRPEPIRFRLEPASLDAFVAKAVAELPSGATVQALMEPTGMSRSRILLADDHVMLAEALKRLLADDVELVGIVEDGRALVAAARTLAPDVVVADISMPTSTASRPSAG